MSNIIKQHYTAIAETLFKNTYEDMCAKTEIDNDELKKLCFDITFNRDGREDITDVNEAFYEMLDKIEAEIEPEPAEERKSFSDFYKNEGVINMQIDVTDYINETATAETVIANIEKALLKKVSYKRIAELFYYKRNHRWYDRGLEQAYREVVDSFLGFRNDNVLYIACLSSGGNDKEIKEITDRIHCRAIIDVYAELKRIPIIRNKYKLKKEVFMDRVNAKCEFKMINSYNFNIKEDKELYSRCCKEKIYLAQYLSLNECYDSSVYVSESTFGRVFTEKMLVLAGNGKVKYKQLVNNCENKGCFIFVALREKLVEEIKKYNSKKVTSKLRKSKSRFAVINSLKDYKDVADLIQFVNDIIELRNMLFRNDKNHIDIIDDDEAKLILMGAEELR